MIFPDWYYTTYNGKSSYIKAEYIANGILDIDSSTTAYINTKSNPLNLRKSASKDNDIITAILKGTAVIEYVDSWCYIEWNGYKGYASTDYLLF